MSASYSGDTWLDHRFSLTFFDSYGASKKLEEPYSLRSLAPRINAQTAAKKDKLPWLKLARFGDTKSDKGSLRHNENVLAVTGIEADYDQGGMDVDQAVETLEKSGILAMVYTSPSHTEDAPRLRVLCPFSQEMPPERRDAMLGRLNGLFGGVFAGESWTLSQSYYFGSVNHNPSHRVALVDGSPIDQHDELDAIWRGKPDDPDAKPHLNGTATHVTSKHGLVGEIFQVAWALNIIPNDKDWIGWNNTGGRLWNATSGSEAGRDLWHAWSARHPAYDKVHTNERWDHYVDHPYTDTGAGTLIYEARKNLRKQGLPSEYDYGAVPPGHQDTQDVPQDVPLDEADCLPLTWFADITPVPDAKDFLQGVLTERSASVVYGESNAGKTFWATDLALHVAAGRQWNGRRIEQGAVIYCVLEGSMGFRNRVAAWRAEFCDTTDIPFAAIECGINLLNPDADMPKLVSTIHYVAQKLSTKVVLVVIDTLSRALAGGNENSPEDMGALVVNVDQVRQRTGAHVMFIHHSGKDAAKGARGHSLLRAAIDTEIEVMAEEGSPRKTATVVKQRELQKGAIFEFSLSIVKVGENRYGEEVTTCLVQPSMNEDASPISRKLSGNAARAREVLENLLASSGQSGWAGTPSDTASVPEQWWRERFYDAAMAGAEDDAKRKAFRRAADTLIEKKVVAMGAKRVWLVRKQPAYAPAEADGAGH